MGELDDGEYAEDIDAEGDSEPERMKLGEAE
jgi:hypothetical protein